MATDTKTRPTQLEPAIESLLARLRRRIRSYLWADCLAAIVVLLGLGFWISLAVDWLFEPPRAMRVAMLVLFAAALVYVLSRFLLGRIFVRLGDRNMAVLLERRFGNFRDSLLTSVELAERPDHAADFNREMLRHTQRDALELANQVDLGAIFNVAPLVRRASLAVALAVAAVVFAVAVPQAFGIWARRTFLTSDELWPRQTHLSVEGFDEHGHKKIARGSDWELSVKADAAVGRAIPEIVQVRYSSSEGARGRENMSRDGVVTPGEGAFQNYTHAFKSVLAPLEFYVHGGDDRRGPFFLDVVDSPTMQMTLHCEYPAYMRREPRDVPGAGFMQLPRGTQVTIVAEANKPLVSVQIDDLADENTPVTHQLELAHERGAPQKTFRYELGRLDADKTLLFTLRDADGIRSASAVRLALAAVPDEPPQVNVQLKGIGTAITPEARLPAAGEVSDDYGVAKIWFSYHVDDVAPVEAAFKATLNNDEKLPVADVMEVRELQLKPKQKLHWAVQAADACTLDGQPNVGASQRYALDVVTPEQLRSMLEARELMLRRRFETIVEEFTDTRNLLAGVHTSDKPAQPATAQPAPGAGGEPDDATPQATGAGQTAAARSVAIERVTQNSQRSSHEILQVAAAFDDIREEMINNRVDTEELKMRLKDGVADPLRRIVAERFPKLEEQLKQLATVAADPQMAPAAQTAALAQMDAILIEMRQVLDKILELETFNEVLDMLRQIIDAQEKVNAATKQKQKAKIRDLTD